MRARTLGFALSLVWAVALASFAGVRTANAAASDALAGSLAAMQLLGPDSFRNVVGWAKSGAPQVTAPIRDYELTLDRRGTFSPGIGIMTYDSLQDFVQSGFGNRSFADNCATVQDGIAAVPILTARYATYRMMRVVRADGSTWPSAEKTPTP